MNPQKIILILINFPNICHCCCCIWVLWQRGKQAEVLERPMCLRFSWKNTAIASNLNSLEFYHSVFLMYWPGTAQIQSICNIFCIFIVNSKCGLPKLKQVSNTSIKVYNLLKTLSKGKVQKHCENLYTCKKWEINRGYKCFSWNAW